MIWRRCEVCTGALILLADRLLAPRVRHQPVRLACAALLASNESLIQSVSRLRASAGRVGTRAATGVVRIAAAAREPGRYRPGTRTPRP